jgi:hypothetical protein
MNIKILTPLLITTILSATEFAKIGDIVLDVSSIDVQKQADIWNKSRIKKEFLSNFPNFEDMRDFVDDKVVGDALKNRLKETIDSIEERFIAGEIGADKAKREFTL